MVKVVVVEHQVPVLDEQYVAAVGAATRDDRPRMRLTQGEVGGNRERAVAGGRCGIGRVTRYRWIEFPFEPAESVAARLRALEQGAAAAIVERQHAVLAGFEPP